MRRLYVYLPNSSDKINHFLLNFSSKLKKSSDKKTDHQHKKKFIYVCVNPMGILLN